jgi:hypothetical protein
MFRQAIHCASGAMPISFFWPRRSTPLPIIVPTVCVPWPPPMSLSSSHGSGESGGQTAFGLWIESCQL